MQRDTKKITLPVSKKEVELVTFITGREKRALTNALIGSVSGVSADMDSVQNLNPAALDKAQELAWKTVIVSYDGKKDGDEGFNLIETILDSHSADYKAIVDAVNGVTSDKDFLA